MINWDALTRWWIQIKNKRKESGQALVEFAFVLPILLILIFGIIEFGRIYNTQLVITSCAREGARAAIVSGGDVHNAIESAVSSLNVTVGGTSDSNAMVKNFVPDSDKIIWCVNTPEGNEVGNPIEVYVKGSVGIMVPFIEVFTGPIKPISAVAVMRIES